MKPIKRILLKIKLFLNRNAKKAIDFCEDLKKLINNPAIDVATAFTKTPIDDAIVKVLRAALTAFLPGTDSVYLTNGELLVRAVEVIKVMSPELKDSALLKLASIILRELEKSELKALSASDADKKIQDIYKKLKELK